MAFLRKARRLWRSWRISRLSQEQALSLSLYPELPRKPLCRIRRELFRLCRSARRSSWSLQDTLLHYFNMGLDRAGQDAADYVFQVEMDTRRDRLQPPLAVVLSDKWITAQYLEKCGIPTSRPLFAVTPFTSGEAALELLASAAPVSRFFAKRVDGIQGHGAFAFEMRGSRISAGGELISPAELMARLKGCIVEPYIAQHEALNRLYPHGVSSLRIITVCQGGSISLIIAALHVGAGGLGISNLCQGGLRIAIDPRSGALEPRALRLAVQRGWYSAHPDTGHPFAGFTIPHWRRVVSLVTRAHRCFPSIHSIGWDVAVSSTGPLIIEANADWGSISFQYTMGPGRELMNKYFPHNIH